MARIKRKSKIKPITFRLNHNLFVTEHSMLFLGDQFHWLKLLPDNSIDSCVVDGPYGLEFMGEEWDTFSAGIEEDAKSAGGYGKDSATNENAYAAARVRHGKLWTRRPAKDAARAEGRNRATDGTLPVYTGGELYQNWNEQWAREVFRVLKPGGFLLAFGGGRTFHRLACGIENAGFEIRDMIEWLYGTGFPKSSNVGRMIDMKLCKEPGRHYEVNLPSPKKRKSGDHICKRSDKGMAYDGIGTALKPAHEPICMARKPLSEKTIAQNVMKWGTGGLNIQACEIGRDLLDIPGWHKSGADGSNGFIGTSTFKQRKLSANDIQERRGGKGRWPANVIMDAEAGAILNGQSGLSKSTGKTGRGGSRSSGFNMSAQGTVDAPMDAGGASRFFYCPKPSPKERDLGLDGFEQTSWVQWQTANGTSGKASSISEGRKTKRRNIHPTIKPVDLMGYLIRLVTPPGGTVLDNMFGSGTTGVAAVRGGYKFIGGERKPQFFFIGKARVNHAESSKEAGETDRSGGLPPKTRRLRAPSDGISTRLQAKGNSLRVLRTSAQPNGSTEFRGMAGNVSTRVSGPRIRRKV